MTNDNLRPGKAGRSLWRPTGFRVSDRGDGLFQFEDMNPEVKFSTKFSRWETLRLALWLLRRSVWRHRLRAIAEG